jgi:hypothetical protein
MEKIRVCCPAAAAEREKWVFVVVVVEIGN